ncbi:basic proline-rich protein-like [Trichosurus vulpecula]|uniref:basic proline-rich protein-like n=1 Tax=Trichosurus vulpecula TaxID=9337 RepID=UPI00186AE8E3|nr:basic proline-rich protein-like [Trichosurus vulpecula]
MAAFASRCAPPPPVWRPGSPPRGPPLPGLFLPTPNRAPAASVTWAWEYGAGEGPGGRASAGCALPRPAVRPSRWSESLAAAPREPGRAAGEGPAGQRSRRRESPEERRPGGPAAEPSPPPGPRPPTRRRGHARAQPGPPPTRDARPPLARARLERGSERASQRAGPRASLPAHGEGGPCSMRQGRHRQCQCPRETRSRLVSPRA